jgi:hypothetical protein
MKTWITVFTLGILAAIAFGAEKAYDLRRTPRITLPVAYEEAMRALGAATNKFYCVAAALADISPDGGWEMRFFTESGDGMMVQVPFTGKPTVLIEEKVRR